MAEARITSKGQVTIPKVVRDRLDLRTGDRLDFTVEENGIMKVEPLNPAGDRRPLRGFLADAVEVERPVSTEEMDRAVEVAARDRYLAAVGRDRPECE